MRKPKKDYPDESPSWLDTYSDMVTLLLTFFVLLFSMSTMNASKWQKLVTALSKNFPSTTTSTEEQVVIAPSSNASSAAPKAAGKDEGIGNEKKPVTKVTDFDQLYAYIKQYVDKNNLQSKVDVSKGDGYTFISFQNSIFFDGNSSALRNDGKNILDFLNDAMSAIPDQIGEIRFYGHTAQVSKMDTPDKIAFDRTLSTERANNVLLYVQSKGIITGDKMQSTGLGQFHPKVKQDGTEATLSQNRRVEIYISKTGKSEDVLDKVYNDIENSKKSSSSTASTAKSTGN
ncbi:MAG TPA: hypothetical protein DIV41_06640 [Ruminococcaceae bacterium]|jgi:chemotaxis protein MotB|nr:hypothetical protein [Oscillospiraceae bacterium]